MKIVFIGEDRECIGFRLGGVETVPVGGAGEFKEAFSSLISDKHVGIVIVSDRFYEPFLSFSEKLRKRARPVVVFVPSFDGIHVKKSLKEFLYEIFGLG